jgi:t-SNARE complex subunit (syntaxin)
MDPKKDHASHDQFDRVLREMEKLSQLFNEVEQAIKLAKGINRHEAQRALDKARADVEVAQYWMKKAIDAARTSNNGPPESI